MGGRGDFLSISAVPPSHCVAKDFYIPIFIFSTGCLVGSSHDDGLMWQQRKEIGNLKAKKYIKENGNNNNI